MMSKALKGGVPAAIFFVFAAWPSVSQEFLVYVLRDLGLPNEIITFISNLYLDNKCVLSLCGSKYDGFPISAGIRQGCPLPLSSLQSLST